MVVVDGNEMTVEVLFAPITFAWPLSKLLKMVIGCVERDVELTVANSLVCVVVVAATTGLMVVALISTCC